MTHVGNPITNLPFEQVGMIYIHKNCTWEIMLVFTTSARITTSLVLFLVIHISYFTAICSQHVLGVELHLADEGQIEKK